MGELVRVQSGTSAGGGEIIASAGVFFSGVGGGLGARARQARGGRRGNGLGLEARGEPSI
jgi:hypothetical protein